MVRHNNRLTFFQMMQEDVTSFLVIHYKTDSMEGFNNLLS